MNGFDVRYYNNVKNGIFTPAMPILPHGVERYVVAPGCSRTVKLEAGDQVTLINSDGAQIAELLAFGEDGTVDSGLIGAKNSRDAIGLKQILAQKNDMASMRLKTVLQQCGIDVNGLSASIAFDMQSVAEAQEEYYAQATCWLIVVVPAYDMAVDQQNVASEIILYITRSAPGEKADRLLPPEPLYDPIIDVNIQPGNAVTYEVAAGDYIQILDVQGRECSDFQAFSKAGLDRGEVCEIDPTTTRSLMGALYPTPGIYSKYYSYHQVPLIEIIQDTCGRHDTFGLACTARYYEDMGYPGHVNCTDNINLKLARYDIKPRKGWVSINFFFNTLLDSSQAIGMDDPWSRAGDYVLLQAMSDVVCVSTACPCDIDPANGWDPTDIQVRTYRKDNPISRSIGWRKSVEKEMIETKESAFHSCFARFTKNFGEYNGYWLANNMSNHGAIAEYWACREKAVVMDLSPLRKYEITGPDALQLMQLCLTRDVQKISVGEVVYSAICYEHGGMIDDGTVFRLGDNNFRWVGGTDDSGLWLQQQASKHNLNVWVKCSTEQLCNIAVQGPRSRDILQELFWSASTQSNVSELDWFRFSIARLGNEQGVACIVSRTGYSGELGYEVFCHPRDAVQIFDAIWAKGEPLGMLPAGLEALDMLRIEAGLIFAGSEFSDQTDPFEAGIGFTVPLKSKKSDFISREALTKRKASPQKKLVGLNIAGNLVPDAGSCLRVGKAQVGEITSATRSPILDKVIALARVDVTYANHGTEIDVGQLDGKQKKLAATICPFPHFDPTKQRVRGNYSENI